MLAHHEMTINIINVLLLLILAGMIVHVVEKWGLATTLPKWLRTHAAPKNRNKPRRTWRRKKGPVYRGGTQPPAPVHQQEPHVPRQNQECKKYSWESPDMCPPMDADAKEEGPYPNGPDQKEKEWLRARLAHLLDGELDGINIM
jgi:hypothetical protein